jgi:hypothetical protein
LFLFWIHENGWNPSGHGHTLAYLLEDYPTEKTGEEEATEDALAPFYVEDKKENSFFLGRAFKEQTNKGWMYESIMVIAHLIFHRRYGDRV